MERSQVTCSSLHHETQMIFASFFFLQALRQRIIYEGNSVVCNKLKKEGWMDAKNGLV